MEQPLSPESENSNEELINAIYMEMATQPCESSQQFERYIEELAEAYDGTEVATMLLDVSRCLDPQTGRLRHAGDYPMDIAFHRGGLLALRIAHGILGDEFSEKILKYKIDIAYYDGDDPVEELRQSSDGVLQLGARGYEESEEFLEFIEEIEDEMCPDVSLLPYARRGFGFIMYHVHKYQEMESAKDLAESELEGVDWNEELSSLLKNY